MPAFTTAPAFWLLENHSQPLKAPPIELVGGYQENYLSTATPPGAPTINKSVDASASNPREPAFIPQADSHFSISKKPISKLNPLAPEFHSLSIDRARKASVPQQSHAVLSTGDSISPSGDSQIVAMGSKTPYNHTGSSETEKMPESYKANPSGSSTGDQPSRFPPDDFPLEDSTWSRKNNTSQGMEPWNKRTNSGSRTASSVQIEHVEQGKEYMRAIRASKNSQETLPKDRSVVHTGPSPGLAESRWSQGQASSLIQDPAKGANMHELFNPFEDSWNVADNVVAKNSDALRDAWVQSPEPPYDTDVKAWNDELEEPIQPPVELFAALKLSTETHGDSDPVGRKHWEDFDAEAEPIVPDESNDAPDIWGLEDITNRLPSPKVDKLMPQGFQAEVGRTRGPRPSPGSGGPRAHIALSPSSKANVAGALRAKKTASQRPARDRAAMASREGDEDPDNQLVLDKWPTQEPGAVPGQRKLILIVTKS